ncbi:MAG: hypothetical protein ACRCWJ_06450 [Casimicrobium sp.]
MQIDRDTIADYIPYYLTQDEKTELASVLRNWPNPIQYYLNSPENGVLQGDAWSRVPIRNYASGELGRVDVVVLSNTCDLDQSNLRLVPQRAIVAPLISVAKYRQLLSSRGADDKRIEDQCAAIRQQKPTNLFYLPAGGSLREESIIRFDDVHSVPTRDIGSGVNASERIASLSMVGFYLFVLKLSVHFCRMHERVNRFEARG